MKANILSLFTVIFTSFLLNGCTSSDEPATEQEESTEQKDFPYVNIPMQAETRSTVDNSNHFAIDLAKTFCDTNEKMSNFCISPFSVFSTLSMLAQGDDGEIREEILGIIGSGKDISSLNDFNNTLIEYLPKLDGKTECRIANSLWHNPQMKVTAGMGAIIEESYHGVLKNIAPKGESGKSAINDWIKMETKGELNNFLKEPLSCEVALINATYFHGEWTNPFKEEMTGKGMFSNNNISKTEVDFMNSSIITTYSEADGVKIMSLPYGNGNYEMTVIQPETGKTIADILNSDLIDRISDKKNIYDVKVSMPKFQMDFSGNIISNLSSLGFEKTISKGYAGILENEIVNFDTFLHGAGIKVDEKGTTASAATIVGGDTAVLFPEASMILDHPFLFIIRETSTGTFIFIGAVVEL